jgi:hypothetical protein
MDDHSVPRRPAHAAAFAARAIFGKDDALLFPEHTLNLRHVI